ncbi:Glutaredoxin family protein [Vibrio crassostreae]|nr:Glutaredoxin family protein [Vibrio crassostreae]CAK2885346.1 Glutaredoxin family protein [Vibrio crassostreae]CAK2886102.1 Glutaredoxin family protein [Vibrio crassostreae]CAK2891437.1 Glutaredoxin family protein [Vibrio crassostreae]CAK2892684.1 Glutaredoxin family protein [Vibrio crassostreae]
MLTLYSTEGCHLCEMAFQLAEQLNISHHVNVVDIAFDDELFSRYGVTIPVLKFESSDLSQSSELNWPFGLLELKDWLKKNGITYNS